MGVYRDNLREPVSVVLLTMFFDGLAIIQILIVELPLSFGVGLDMQINTIWQAGVISFVVASLVEELFKFGVLQLCSARHNAFDEPFDGIVYGIVARLGFALIDNIGYILISMDKSGRELFEMLGKHALQSMCDFNTILDCDTAIEILNSVSGGAVSENDIPLV